MLRKNSATGTNVWQTRRRDFLGANPDEITRFGVHSAETLADAADIAVALSEGKSRTSSHLTLSQSHIDLLEQHAHSLSCANTFAGYLPEGPFVMKASCYASSRAFCQLKYAGTR